MFPIYADVLSFPEIADYWASKLALSDPKLRLRREEEIRDLLESAWWRGELFRAGKPARLHILRSFYKMHHDEIAFVVPGQPAPPEAIDAADGGLIIIRRIRVELPSDDPARWTEESCEPAFESLAKGWQRMGRDGISDATQAYSLFEPALCTIKLDRAEFLKWVAARKYDPPKFWGDHALPESSRVTGIGTRPKRSRGAKPIKRERIASIISEKYPGGIPADVPLKTITRLVETTAGFSVSERSVRRALGGK